MGFPDYWRLPWHKPALEKDSLAPFLFRQHSLQYGCSIQNQSESLTRGLSLPDGHVYRLVLEASRTTSCLHVHLKLTLAEGSRLLLFEQLLSDINYHKVK